MSHNQRMIDLLLQVEELRQRNEKVDFQEICRECPELLSEVRQRANWLAVFNPPAIDAEVTTVAKPKLAAESFSRETAENPSSDATTWLGASRRYAAVGLHAQGALGEVHLAEDQELGRRVALKRIQPQFAGNRHFRQRFLREAEITGQLEHPGVAPVYGLVEDAEGQPCYAMRFIDGESLDHAIAEFHRRGARDSRGDSSGNWRRDLRRLIGHFVTVCNTMAYAHDRGVIHRDLKPSNMMLGKFGETLVVDWGLARRNVAMEDAENQEDTTSKNDRRRHSSVEADEATRVGDVIGTPAYMSPEQASGVQESVGPLSDIFSLGASLYHLFTGDPPLKRMDDVRQGAVPQPPHETDSRIPRALSAICGKAMAPSPEDRYETALALAADLERWLSDEPTAAYRDRWTERAARWRRKHRALVSGSLVTGLIALLSLVAGVWMLAQTNAKERRLRKDEEVAKKTAETEEKETERLLVEQLVQTGKSNAQRGRWRDAIAHYDAALESGYDNKVEIELAKLEAFNALVELDNVRQGVEKLAARMSEAKHPGQIALWQGDVDLLAGKGDEAANRVRQAIQLGLPDADRAYARGLLAPSAPKALEYFQQALEMSPYHHRAMQQAVFQLILLGRREQITSHLRAAAVLFPEDPVFVLAWGMMDAIGGDAESAKQRLHSSAVQFDEQSLQAAGSVFEILTEFSRLVIRQTSRAELSASIGRLFQFLNSFNQLTEKHPGLSSSIRFPPGLHQVFGNVGQVTPFNVLLKAKTLFVNPDNFQKLVEIWPEGLWYFLLGQSYVSKKRFADGQRAYALALETPSLVPHVRREALYGVAMCETMLAIGGDQAMYNLAVKHAQERSDTPPFPDAFRAYHMALVTWRAKKYDLSSDILSESLKRYPKNDLLLELRVKVELDQQDYAEAVRAADAALAQKPTNPSIRNQRETAMNALKQIVQ